MESYFNERARILRHQQTRPSAATDYPYLDFDWSIHN